MYFAKLHVGLRYPWLYHRGRRLHCDFYRVPTIPLAHSRKPLGGNSQIMYVPNHYQPLDFKDLTFNYSERALYHSPVRLARSIQRDCCHETSSEQRKYDGDLLGRRPPRQIMRIYPAFSNTGCITNPKQGRRSAVTQEYAGKRS